MVKEREPFEIARADGRSNSMVVCDLVKVHNEPGRVFTYEEIGEALSRGCDRGYDLRSTQAAVRNSGPRLGRILKRTLHNVAGTGYRLALAEEHHSLSIQRQVRAGRQLQRGFEILRDTRFDEITDPQAKRAHEGQLLIFSAILHQMQAQEHRLNRHEKLIEQMLATSGVEKDVE